MLIRFGLELTLLVAVVVFSIRKGVLWGFCCTGIILLINLVPMRERWAFHDGQVSARSIHWRFHFSWWGVWLSLIFGAWVIFPPVTWLVFPPVARHFVWLVFLPVFPIQALISLCLPIISYRWVSLRCAEGRTYRFLLLGTWWGDELSIRSEHPDKLDFELACEVGRLHVSLRPGREYGRFARTLEDNTFVGLFPKIERVELEHYRPAGHESQAVNAVTG